MLERKFQSCLIKEIKEMFPGCIVLKNDPNYLQGVPDLTILWKDKWATLEVKKSEKAPFRPNQEYYISLMHDMSFSKAIHPKNKEMVLLELQHAFGA